MLTMRPYFKYPIVKVAKNDTKKIPRTMVSSSHYTQGTVFWKQKCTPRMSLMSW